MPTAFELVCRTTRAFYGLFLDTPPFLDSAREFPGAVRLEADWQDMRAEALDVLRGAGDVPRFHELLEDQASISANDGVDWRMFVLRAYGRDQEQNMARCPRTAALLREMPEVTSATFSILGAGKHVPAHRGPYRGILRYQLGLVVPLTPEGEPAAELRVENETYTWREGEGVLWDDTYEHEVWNRGEGPRVVLLLDVLRPQMPAVLRVSHHLIYGGVSRSKGLDEFLAKSAVPPPADSGVPREGSLR